MEEYSKIEEWFLEFGSDVNHFLVYYLGQHNVEDLVQDVFIKALKGLPNFEGKAGPKTWLFAIARNVAIDYERKKKITGLLSIRLMKDRKDGQALDESFLLREDLEKVYRIVRKLKRSFKEVLFYRIFEDFSIAETAEILGWTTSKVNVTLHRAIKIVREKYLQNEGGVDLAIRGERE
jgi:RNA polymerase sigma-70 factor, ECF subfamily